MYKADLKQIIETYLSEGEQAVVKLKIEKNNLNINISNDTFEVNYNNQLNDEEDNKNIFGTYDLRHLAKVLDNIKSRYKDKTQDKQVLTKIYFNNDKLIVKTDITENINLVLTDKNIERDFEEIWTSKIIDLSSLLSGLKPINTIRVKLEGYPEMAEVNIFEDEKKGLHFLSTNGYSVYDLKVQLENALMRGKSFYCNPRYLKNVSLLPNQDISAGFGYFEDKPYLIFIDRDNSNYLLIKMEEREILFAQKLAIPKTNSIKINLDFDKKLLQKIAKDVKGDLKSSEQKRFALFLFIKDGKLYMNEQYTGIDVDLPDLKVNYADLMDSFTEKEIEFLENDEYIVLKNEYSKLIVKK